ncbi:MAG: VOC family protein [Bdellovibrionota bacterium]
MNLGTYFEIPVDDLDRAIEFYSRVFSCDFEKTSIHGNEMAFFPFEVGSRGITGALAKGESYKPSLTGTLIYMDTNDIDSTLRKVLGSGGQTLFPKSEVPSYGWAAEFKDSEGNRVGLFQRL